MSRLDASNSTSPAKPRAARTLTGWIVRLSFWVVLLTLIGGVLVMANGWRPPSTPVPTAAAPRPKKVAPPDPLAASARQAARSVVSIQTVGQGNTRNLGAGFVIEGDLIATNFHVVSSATQAQVRFADGRLFAVQGYAAALPQHDLAILRLEAPPNDLAPLPFATQSPAPASQVMAIGHPRGVEFAFVAGRVSQRVKTSQLSDDAQRFVQKLTGSSEELTWLQHTATLAEGNSGGPLIDDQGTVVGINTWISRETGANYALTSEALRALAASVTSQTRPLLELARPDVRAAAVVARLSAARVQTLFESAEAQRWLPASAADYRPFQELALAMMAAHLPQSFEGDATDEARIAELQTAVTRIEDALHAKTDFGAPDQITIVNEQAAAALRQPFAGVFCFAEVVRVVSGDHGQRGMLMQLVGDAQPLFVSLDGQLLEPQPGEIYALLGVNLRGEVVRYGDNPLKLTTAPVIVSRTLIPLAAPPGE